MHGTEQITLTLIAKKACTAESVNLRPDGRIRQQRPPNNVGRREEKLALREKVNVTVIYLTDTVTNNERERPAIGNKIERRFRN